MQVQSVGVGVGGTFPLSLDPTREGSSGMPLQSKINKSLIMRFSQSRLQMGGVECIMTYSSKQQYQKNPILL